MWTVIFHRFLKITLLCYCISILINAIKFILDFPLTLAHTLIILQNIFACIRRDRRYARNCSHCPAYAKPDAAKINPDSCWLPRPSEHFSEIWCRMKKIDQESIFSSVSWYRGKEFIPLPYKNKYENRRIRTAGTCVNFSCSRKAYSIMLSAPRRNSSLLSIPIASITPDVCILSYPDSSWIIWPALGKSSFLYVWKFLYSIVW